LFSLPTKISKTTPCKETSRPPAGAISQKHFDTSGKSPAQLHHRAICKTPTAPPGTGLVGAMAGKNPHPQLKLHRSATAKETPRALFDA
jgi:hypothetical protein